MTVSQMFFNMKITEAGVNWEVFRKALAKEEAKGDEGDVKKVKRPEYDPEDPDFAHFIKAIALTTTASFSYTPKLEEVRARLARQKKVDLKKIDEDPKQGTPIWDELEAVRDEMVAEEAKQNYIKRVTLGDASETGLIRFAQPLLMKEHGGAYGEGLEEMRAQFPTVVCGESADGKQKDRAQIPFNSDIKFNMLIRDLNTDDRAPAAAADNVCIFIKGAPERIIKRCSRVYVAGEELAFTDARRKQVDLANSAFGKMGERVLAFAKHELDPEVYPKADKLDDLGYPFDVTGWQAWDETVKTFSRDTAGWFPHWDYCLVGLISLNDPPRPKVDVSVQKCRNAGVQVIMVTGDQPPTAAAIAHKVNIITKPELEYNAILEKYKEEHKDEEDPEKREMDPEEAFALCNAIVIHGDQLSAVHAREDGMEDDEIEKGRQVMDWIRKPEVVFARTSPSQKLLIVDACQRLGHVVAVTGDGVNDSPALKKADIGIAMGCGSQVAQNAADMLLLDDNFSSIVNGVEEGRLIFDNLKKSIAYTLSSNIPEISPFIIYMAFQVPLPLSTVLILCIDLGTDMVPAISFAYENPELDIMERFPRNSKRDHLVNAKLVSFAYLQIGIVQASAGFFTYFYMLNDYGFKPATLFGLIQEIGHYPNHTDIYDPTEPNCKGNTVCDIADPKKDGKMLDWNTNQGSETDARLFYHNLPVDAWTQCRWDPGAQDGWLNFFNYSWISNQQVCYSTEALKYAQCGYLISIVCVQWSDLMICKTRALSISQQGMLNNNSNFALFFETALVAFLSYFYYCNLLLGTRCIAFPHFAIPSFSCFAIIMFYDECRKIFLRRGQVWSKTTGRMKQDGWVVRNTYY